MADEYVIDDTKDRNAARRSVRRERYRQQERRATGAQIRQAPRRVTERGPYSAKGMLTAELLAGGLLVLIRVVADFEVQTDGTVQGKVLHPKGQYGPMPILAGLIGSFFVLSFLAASGGTKAKVAVLFGGVIVLTLGMNSVNEIKTVSGTIGNIGSISVPGASGSEGSGASSSNTSSSSSSTGSGPGSSTSSGSTKNNGSSVSNASNAASRALSSANDAITSGSRTAGLTAVGDLAKAIGDESTAAVDQLTHVAKDVWDKITSWF
jgi:hypothetical protein